MARNVEFDIIARDRASKTFDHIGKASSSLGTTLKGVGGIAAGAAVTGIAALAAGIGGSISKAMDYDKTMRMVGATLGATGEQQKSLGKLALKMGADTVFSAKDASSAMLELAKGGLTAAQIQGGALSATMTLAAAGGLEMGSAATYVGNALHTFGLSAKQANSVAAALAGGANASSASVESLGLALGQVGPGAKSAGVSIQETVGILAAFDNAGIKGADAGTSLKTMLTRLVPSTKKAAGEMRELGLKFTDAKGQFLPMANVAEQLKNKLSKLSDEQRTQALSIIFGSDATRAATVLMGLGAKGVNDYTKATSDQAAAQRLANTQMQGASGAWEQFKGSVETLAITLGTALLPAFTVIVKALTKVTNAVAAGVGPAFQKVLPIVKAFGGWITSSLWPALQQGARTILPALKQALAIIGGAFKGSGKDGGSFKEIMKSVGDIITKVVIPVLSWLARTALPLVATHIRLVIEVVKILGAWFTTLATITGRVITYILRGFAQMATAGAFLLRALSHVPGFRWAKAAADKLQAAANKANALANAINRIPRNVTVNTYFQTHGTPNPGSTQGSGAGYKGFATGGRPPLGKVSIVGEQGPEFFVPDGPGTIYTMKQAASMAKGGGSASSASDQPIIVQFVLDGRVVQQSLLKLKRQGGTNLGLA